MNGWTNSDTWRAMLNLSNNELTYSLCSEKSAREIKAVWQIHRQSLKLDKVDAEKVNWEEIAEAFRE